MYLYIILMVICIIAILLVTFFVWRKRDLIAFDIVKRKAEKGNSQSQMILGFMYYTGDGIIKGKNIGKNIDEAVKWFTAAAENGESQAQYILSSIYLKNENNENSSNKGIMWLTKAAENGLSSAQLSLATLYSEGNIVTKNHKEAIKWFTIAAENGNVMAQKTIAGIYHFSIGFDKKVAYSWYKVASVSGDEYSEENANKLYDEFTETEKEEATSLALEYINKYKRNKN